ncbi:MAG: magnesium protoporphyrin IX methyltransferase [Alphaproteobacteria bacterium]|nr:magnesium protoporphyrin IX methyltransferase [Alphaproteobacteria bacterium]
MSSVAFDDRRSRLETYFNATAMEAWARLTSDAPVSGIRQTVRAGRQSMSDQLLSWLPADLHEARVLDAGCGVGALAVAAARRGARVTGVDIAANLIDIARQRTPGDLGLGDVAFRVGDFLDPRHGLFDHVVAMDSLIHYPTGEIVRALGALARRTRRSLVFTFAPETAALRLMHTAGRIFPRSDRAPAIEPVSEPRLRAAIAAAPDLWDFRVARSARISNGFYISHALELVRR